MIQTQLKANDVIQTIVDNMKDGLEPLVTKTLAPSHYEVRLHVDDLERLKGILPQIKNETRTLLDRELARMNHQKTGSFLAKFGWGGESMTYQRAESEKEWSITFQEDPNGRLEPGEIEVVSELATEGLADFGGGSKTQLISTVRKGGSTASTRTDTTGAQKATPANGREIFAEIVYSDDDGSQRYKMDKETIIIGRQSDGLWRDLTLNTKMDVSRQHVHIRFDKNKKAFFIKDTSSFGTILDGQRITSSLEQVDGELRDTDYWHELPDRAEIQLAGVITLQFERVVS